MRHRARSSERQVILACANATDPGGQHTAHLLEHLLPVELAEALSQPAEPAGKIASGGFPACRHANRFDEPAAGKEGGLLPGMLETVGVRQITRTLRQVARVRAGAYSVPAA